MGQPASLSTFPALSQVVNGHRLIYLDSAATTLRPQAVIDAMADYYSTDNANPSPAHTLASRAGRATWPAPGNARPVCQRDRSERDHLRPWDERRRQPGRQHMGRRPTCAPATRSSSPSPSTTPTCCRGHARPAGPAPPSASSMWTMKAGCASTSSRPCCRRERVSSRSAMSPTCWTSEPGRRDLCARAAGRRARGHRWRAERAPCADRCPGSGLRLLHVLGPQDARADGHRCRVGAAASCSTRCRRITSAATWRTRSTSTHQSRARRAEVPGGHARRRRPGRPGGRDRLSGIDRP